MNNDKPDLDSINVKPELAIPKPMPPSFGRAELKLDEIKVKIDREIKKEITPKTKWRARYAFAKRMLDMAAEEFIPIARDLLSEDTPGADKKKFVRDKLILVLKILEARVNIIPAMFEPLVWKYLQYSLDKIIQEVFDRLRAKGVV